MDDMVIIITSAVFAIIVCGFGLAVHYAHKNDDNHNHNHDSK